METETDREWKTYAYRIIDRISGIRSVDELNQLLLLHHDKLELYRGWNAEKHALLMEFVALKRVALMKEDRGRS